MSFVPHSLGTLVESPRPLQQGATDRDTRLRLFEIFLILFVAFGNFIANSLYVLIYPLRTPLQYTDFSTFLRILQEAGGLLLLGYILHRTRRRFSSIGLRWSLADLGIGLLLYTVAYVAYAGSYRLFALLHYLAFTSFSNVQVHREFPGNPLVFVLPYYLLNPFFEELIVRAYLMTEVAALSGSVALAICASVIFQTAYHLYYGWVTALAMGCCFLVLSAYYAKTRRALPVIVAHALMDILAFIAHLRR